MSRKIAACLGALAWLTVAAAQAQEANDADAGIVAAARAADDAFGARASSKIAGEGDVAGVGQTSLAAAIEEVIAGSALATARVGIEVVSLDTGEVVYARNADEPLNPASNVKLFTSAAALSLLGPGFQFDTEFFAESAAVGAAKRDNLYVRGGGDPTLTSEGLWRIACDLYNRGLRQVTGDIVLDERFFDGERVGAGYDQEDSDRAYMAPPGALSLNWNSVGVHITPARRAGRRANVVVDPLSDFIVVENKTVTRGRRALRRLSVTSALSADGQKQVVTVSGRIPVGGQPVSFWRKVDDPGLYFGHTLKRFLKMRGVEVKGGVRRGAVPTSGVQSLLLHRSETLDLVLKRVNKFSSNVVSEQLVKTLGAKIFGAPGSWRTGLYAIEHFLDAEIGLKPGTYVMRNGSGLNDANRFSAHQINTLLLKMWRNFPMAPEFLSSMGIAAEDGTLQFRMDGTEAERRLRGKTGTLENVSALSGYVQTLGGERFAFSILANDFSGRASRVVPALDTLGATIAAHGAPDRARQQVAAQNTAPILTPLTQLREDLVLFNGIASEEDPRNLPQLFATLKTERDPALRAIVAEAAYRSAPDNPAAVRALIEHADLRPEGFGRLVSLARVEKIATPLVAALMGLAAEGDADALGKVVEIAGLAHADPALGEEVRAPLQEVARNAADELLNVLESSLPWTRQGALALIAHGLQPETATDDSESAGSVSAQAGEASKPPETAEPHPFPHAVARRLKEMTGERAEFAAELRRAFESLLPAGDADNATANKSGTGLHPSAARAAAPATTDETGAQASEAKATATPSPRPVEASPAPSTPATAPKAAPAPEVKSAPPASSPASKAASPAPPAPAQSGPGNERDLTPQTSP